MCYEHVLDCICFNMPTADSPNPYMCETTDYTAYAILIRKTNNYCVHEVETYCIYYSVQLTSLNKKGRNTDTVFSYAELLRNTRLHFDKLDTSRTVERGDVYFSLHQKGRGTDTVLSQVQSLGLRTKSLNISDLRKTLSFRKYLSSSRKRTATYCNVLLQKNGAWHGPSDSGLHATLSKLAAIHDRNWVYKLWNNFSWRETSEASNKGTCGAGETPLLKLHYQIRLSGYTAVCDDHFHPRSPATDWCAHDYQLESVLLSTYWLVEHSNVCGHMRQV